MLVKRTNILFSKEQWKLLSDAAKDQETSVGELVRRAVEKAYGKQARLAQIQEATRTIERVRTRHKNLDYKALINYGRKY